MKIEMLQALCSGQREQIEHLDRKCEMLVRTGARKGEVCGQSCSISGTTCYQHARIRIEPVANGGFRIAGTQALFNPTTYKVVGYVDFFTKQKRFEPSEDTTYACTFYDLEFEAIGDTLD